MASKNSVLIAPYGGNLVDLMIPPESSAGLKAYASQLPSIQISPQSVCDLELLATGAFSPLDRFMGKEDHQRVLDEMRLVSGHIFPIPITLSVDVSPNIRLDQDIALRNNEYELLGVMTIDEIYECDRSEVAEKVFGTQDLRHSMVAELHRLGALNISGRLQVLHLPRHYDFQDLRLTPAHTRVKLTRIGRQKVVAYQPPGSLLRIDEKTIDGIVERVDGTLLLHPAVGLTRLGDVEHYNRIRNYSSLIERSDKPDQVLLSLLPLVEREAGLREALWQALIRRNYGANHVIVSSKYVSFSNWSESTTLRSSDNVQQLLKNYSQELGVEMVPEQGRYEDVSCASEATLSASLTNTHVVSNYPNNGQFSLTRNSPRKFSETMAETYLLRHRQGVCIWFTGLSGAGKSTTAEMLTWLLLEHGRRVTVLDGDVVRTHLSKGLGFSKDDRDINVRRIGFVASELVRHGAVAICAVVSPYLATRNDVRHMVGEDQFVEVFVNTPVEVCEVRDVKGLYLKARRGELKGFTGIDDPYEPPPHPEITLDTVNYTPQENANIIVNHLVEKGFVRVRQKPN